MKPWLRVPSQEYHPVTAIMSCEGCAEAGSGWAADMQTLAVHHAQEAGHVAQVTASQVITYRPASAGSAAA